MTVADAGAGDEATATPATPAQGPPAVPDEGHDEILVRVSWGGTAAYVLAAALASVAEQLFKIPLVLVCCVLFVAGLGAFFAAYAIAVGRSRTDAIGMGGLYFLLGTAPPRVRRHLMASFAVEITVATVTASVGIARAAEGATNLLAFGFLTPLFGLGLAGLWGARNGVFPAREVRSRPPARKGSVPPPKD